MSRYMVGVILAVLALAGCGSSEAGDDAAAASPAATATDEDAAAASPAASDEQRFPEIVEAELEPENGTWTLRVTVSSPYDSPERYADGWRVLAPNGTELGHHELAHDHANEQPFTRTQSGLEIPDDVDEITVEGRDQTHGYGGETVTVEVPGR